MLFHLGKKKQKGKQLPSSNLYENTYRYILWRMYIRGKYVLNPQNKYNFFKLDRTLEIGDLRFSF